MSSEERFKLKVKTFLYLPVYVVKTDRHIFELLLSKRIVRQKYDDLAAY